MRAPILAASSLEFSFFSLLLLALCVVHRTAGPVIDRFKGRFRFDQLADFCNSYRQLETGEPLEYAHLFADI